MKKKKTELKISNQLFPVRTLEIVLKSMPKDYHGYDHIIAEQIKKQFLKDSRAIFTVYSYKYRLVNELTKVCIAIDGPEEILSEIFWAFTRLVDIDVILGNKQRLDYFSPILHVENGYLWKPTKDASVWATDEKPPCLDREVKRAINKSSNEELPEVKPTEGKSLITIVSCDREYTLKEFAQMEKNRPKDNDLVSTVSMNIERLFDLPEGSVELRGRDKKPLRGNTRFETFRKSWKY